MYKHILVPVDGTPLSTGAVGKAIALARALHARITVLTVIEPFHVFAVDPEIVTATPAHYERVMVARAERHLSVAREEAAASGVPCAAFHVMDEYPWRAITDIALREGCDLIAMSSHGRHGLSAVLPGSETMKVLTHARIPVLVYR
jgi:nucleotide-binding universal stress UspA family protein